MNNSKWQINKVGLIDFWYYDEEEFDFLDGRMLLRGANGSGKSVTMQSFIPLLLDGNMRPERLDPFGSRARKMENYLLEEGDDREERTGYLYMEFKRLKSEEYMTLGLGIRARKNKKLESWYFCITDNRRVGQDIFLYKDVENKITCSKTELRNRIGTGGMVMETQGEYAACVNRLLFGFETPEEYKELLELLIQLRTPKLSKDFKPSVINEILSSSLQTLSEDDLRPMSEAIENMDSLKTNLDALNESISAARQIEKVYDQYNQIVLYDKALIFTEVLKNLDICEKTEQENSVKIKDEKELLIHEKQHYENLICEENILKEERDSLAGSDAARLKEQEMKLVQELQEKQTEQKKKESQEQEKKEKQLDADEKLRKEKEKNESIWCSMEECLDEMEEVMEEVPFDEFSFLRKELLEDQNPSYSFSAHNALLKDYSEKVRQGKEGLEEERNSQERYDRYLEELDLCQKERDYTEREVQQYEKLFEETKAELTEKIYIWAHGNKELHPEPDILKEMTRKIHEYELGKDFLEIRDLVKNVMFSKEGELNREILRIEQDKKRVWEELEATKTELEDWKNQKDPEPEQPDSVKENRHRLMEKGIPYMQFYKTIEFDEQLTREQADHLEEALLNMGVLDALIISEEYREQVLALDAGICDKYIFSDVSHVKENLTQVLAVDNGDQDILLYQSISNILSSIGFGNHNQQDGHSWIDRNGNYRIGVLEGTVTKEYKARFIGVSAREEYRKNKIEELTGILEHKENALLLLEEDLNKYEDRKALLKDEWEHFPKEDDLKTAAKSLSEWEYKLGLAVRRMGEQQALTEKERKLLDQIRIRVRELCSKAFLAPRFDLFVQVQDSLNCYKDLLSGLQISWGNYQNSLRFAESQKEYLEELEQDLDEIRYEKIKNQQKIRELEGLLDSARKQLELTDYEQIRERLDICIKRLQELPKERENCVRKQEALEKEIQILEEKKQDNLIKKQELQRKKERYQIVFKKEYDLGYVEKNFVLTEDMEDQARKICRLYAGEFGNKKQNDLFGNLQEIYHQNRGCLLDYQITLLSLFTELDEETVLFDRSVKRIDISAKYRGTPVTFKELIRKLVEDADALSRLLNERDRELFEDILANTISKKIRIKIQASRRWVDKMNMLMESMQTSSGLKLSLRWKNKRAEKEEQLDTRTLVELLQKDAEIMREEEAESLSRHFRSKIQEARKIAGETGAVQSFHAIMREVLDYRKWFEFQLECQKTGEKKRELTDRVFFTFSGGEKAMAMYVPLFSAVVAKYAGARDDAPKLISLDEAFAGVDETNIRDMFRLMVEFEFNFMINSQILWGDYDTVPGLAIYQLIRPENARFVSVIRYIWNGKMKIMVNRNEEQGLQ